MEGSFQSEFYINKLLLKTDIDKAIIGLFLIFPLRMFVFFKFFHTRIYFFDFPEYLLFLFAMILYPIRNRLINHSFGLGLSDGAVLLIVLDDFDESFDIVDNIFTIFGNLKLEKSNLFFNELGYL